ncbi:MAG: SagB/ThcOx family dehydrogenase, partial [Methanosarcinaceae archaeon]|nr:SagB/ThcOx family dehydrogenase [Methanosarcinaceae archaeon]
MLGCNFLSKQVFGCDTGLISVLSETTEWTDRAKVVAGPFQGDSDAVDALIEHSAVVVEGSELALKEQEYVSEWHWNVPAGMMHFCLEDADIMSLEESEAAQIERVKREPQPSLFMRNIKPGRIVSLPEGGRSNALLSLMARRRTVRAAAAPSISLVQLADCLYAGMGITGFTSNCVGKLPLGMTPSGGARNPYEAYVFVRSVDGLDPGIYHYSALDHDLGRVSDAQPRFSELVGGQDWADEMPCMIVLVAELRRTMWKYRDPNGYRVVLIEAGHIGQNMMLAATSHGLSVCPTAALSQARIRQLLKLRRITDAPIYAMTLAVPGTEPSVAGIQ